MSNDKNIYREARENMNLTRAAASEELEVISEARIERIETEKFVPHPDEVLIMAEKYKVPDMINYYCATQCPIGEKYVPEIKIKELSVIVLEMLASLNDINANKDRLIEIAVDGKIEDNEIKDFIEIQDKLEKISITVETLQIWSEKMLATGQINKEKYEAEKNNR